jgi:predicted transposase YbfD/YdcC
MLAGLAVDGKTLRGSRITDTTVHLLAAMRHDTQIVLAQQQIEAKSNEIPAFAPLLSGLDLTSVVVTADALHTQQEHARQIIAASGHYLFIAKGNQPTLHRRLKTLPWRDAVLNDRTDETGHGRREIRRMKICTVRPDLPFPYAAQAIQVKRRRTDHRTGKTTIVTIYAVTSLPPGRITHAQLATLIRGHWSIEVLHHIRDVTFREDASKNPHRHRTPDHGEPPKSGHRSDPPHRLDQHHRRHRPLPQSSRRRTPAPRSYNMRTLRPWLVYVSRL